VSVGLLVITHEGIGDALLKTAESMLGFCPLQVALVEISGSCEPDDIYAQALEICQRLDRGQGVLVLTDMFGSTPSNIASRLVDRVAVQAVAGISLPMLVRVLNYPTLNLYELVNKAITGGHDGILLCDSGESV